MQIINISDAKATLSKLIEQVHVLVPYETNKGPRELGGDWENKVVIEDDFDDLPDNLLA